jgi:hypothetical protein
LNSVFSSPSEVDAGECDKFVEEQETRRKMIESMIKSLIIAPLLISINHPIIGNSLISVKVIKPILTIKYIK